MIDRERHALDRLLEDTGPRVVLFGAGGLGRQTLACLRTIGIEPLAISDNNSRLWGSTLDGIEVLPPRVSPRSIRRGGVFRGDDLESVALVQRNADATRISRVQVDHAAVANLLALS